MQPVPRRHPSAASSEPGVGQRALPWRSHNCFVTAWSFAIQTLWGNALALYTASEVFPPLHARCPCGPVPWQSRRGAAQPARVGSPEPGGDACSQRLCLVGRQRWDSCLCWIRTWRRRSSRGHHAGCIHGLVLLLKDHGQWWAQAARQTWEVRGGFTASAGRAALYRELRRALLSEHPVAMGLLEVSLAMLSFSLC